MEFKTLKISPKTAVLESVRAQTKLFRYVRDNNLESAKANLNKWKSALSEYNRLKKETEENSKPVEVKLMEVRSNREQIIREYNIARQILQEEQEKIKNFPFHPYFQIFLFPLFLHRRNWFSLHRLRCRVHLNILKKPQSDRE